MAWPTIPTFAALAALTAAKLNDIRDALNAIGNPWQPYTPVITGITTDPTLGLSVITGRYRKMGNTADVHIDLVIGSGWAAGSGGYVFSLPTASDALGVVTPLLQNGSEVMGYGTVRDVSVPTTRPCIAYRSTATKVSLLSTLDGSIIAPGNPFTWASGDVMSIHIPSLELA